MKQDRKLVAYNQAHEIKYISSKFDVPKDVVKKAMIDCGKNSKPSRSRKVIYAALRQIGYEIITKK